MRSGLSVFDEIRGAWICRKTPFCVFSKSSQTKPKPRRKRRTKISTNTDQRNTAVILFSSDLTSWIINELENLNKNLRAQIRTSAAASLSNMYVADDYIVFHAHWKLMEKAKLRCTFIGFSIYDNASKCVIYQVLSVWWTKKIKIVVKDIENCVYK